jgi:hypothetical protein
MKLKTKIIALLALASSALVIPANAAVTFTAGDLILAVRSATEGKTFMVNLGSSIGYRNATADNTSVVTILTDLNANFVNWQNRADVTWSIFGVRASSTLAGDPGATGDPGQTIYISRAQSPLGTQETAWGVAGQLVSASNHTNAAVNITGVQANEFNNALIGTESATVNGKVIADASTVYDTLGNTWGAFTASNGTVVGSQGNFGAGTAGTALDLFRSLGTTSGANPTGTARVGSYEGTFHINDLGVVGYSVAPTFGVIPEPSRALLLGLGATGLLFRRRRSAQAA